MATALGIRARGVLIEGRPGAETRPPRLGFGVVKGELGGRVGDDVERDVSAGEGRVRAGLAGSRPRKAGEAESRELSCLAVMETYLDARDPAVSLSVSETGLTLGGGFGFARTRARARAAGVVPGVARPAYDGVIRPPFEGVVRPVEADGVMRELVLNDMEVDGVVRPPREDATEDGRWTAPGPTVGGESFVVATKTPQLGGHEK